MPGFDQERTLFFARVLRAASDAEIRTLFEQHGQVATLNVFRSSKGALTSKVRDQLK